MSERKFNFNPGPAVLPVEVIETVKENLLNYKGSGIGLIEMSHRGPDFEGILAEAISGFRSLLSIGDNYDVIFTTGGATNQFSMVPMNLLSKGKVADYIITGAWAEKACSEAKKFGEVNVAASAKEKNFTYIPQQLSLSEDAAYVHFTSNNTIFGCQFKKEPEVGNRVLICDASSDFLYKKIDINKYGLIYAGAQKNLGPAGVTIVIIRKDLLERTPKGLPIMMDYNTYTKNNSLYNTPPCFAIYVVAEVLKWIGKNGGLGAMEKKNIEKSGILYNYLDTSSYYKAPVEKDSRSLMNVVFRLPNPELEDKFIKEAKVKGFIGLKGHRSVGGIRASIYNAFPKEGVSALVQFMDEFQKTN